MYDQNLGIFWSTNQEKMELMFLTLYAKPGKEAMMLCLFSSGTVKDMGGRI